MLISIRPSSAVSLLGLFFCCWPHPYPVMWKRCRLIEIFWRFETDWMAAVAGGRECLLRFQRQYMNERNPNAKWVYISESKSLACSCQAGQTWTIRAYEVVLNVLAYILHFRLPLLHLRSSLGLHTLPLLNWPVNYSDL